MSNKLHSERDPRVWLRTLQRSVDDLTKRVNYIEKSTLNNCEHLYNLESQMPDLFSLSEFKSILESSEETTKEILRRAEKSKSLSSITGDEVEPQLYSIESDSGICSGIDKLNLNSLSM